MAYLLLPGDRTGQLVYPGAKGRAFETGEIELATHSLSSNFSCPSERLPCYVTSAFPLSRNSRSGA